VTASSVPERTVSAGLPGLAAQLPAALGMLAGLWVAISPWFVTPRAPRSGNATADDLIIGLAVAAIGLLAITGIRSMAGLQAARLRPASG
jgi:hypothetical protein